MIPNDGKVVFSLFIILFKFSRFTFCSCVYVCFGLFSCALFGCEMFPFSEVSGWAVFVCKYLMCQVLYYYLVDYLFSGVFLVFKAKKNNLSLSLS